MPQVNQFILISMETPTLTFRKVLKKRPRETSFESVEVDTVDLDLPPPSEPVVKSVRFAVSPPDHAHIQPLPAKISTDVYRLEDADFDRYPNESVQDAITCQLCYNVRRNVSILPRCSHHFCDVCLDSILATKLEEPQVPTPDDEVEVLPCISCPKCRAEFQRSSVVSLTMMVGPMVDNYLVPCLHASCTWKGKHVDLPEHLKTCSLLKATECGYVYTRWVHVAEMALTSLQLCIAADTLSLQPLGGGRLTRHPCVDL